MGCVGSSLPRGDSFVPAALAEDVTAKTLVDRAQIQDLITRYYNNFGRENPDFIFMPMTPS